MSEPSRDAMLLAKSIIHACAGDPKRAAEAAILIDEFAHEAVVGERRRLGNCPECGSSEYVFADEGDFDQTCFDCGYPVLRARAETTTPSPLGDRG